MTQGQGVLVKFVAAIGAFGVAVLITTLAMQRSQPTQTPQVERVPPTGPVLRPVPVALPLPPGVASIPPAQTREQAREEALARINTLAARIAALPEPELIAELAGEEREHPPPYPTFAQLDRGAERYRGQVAVYTGRVLEIHDITDGDGAFLRLDVGNYGANALAVIVHARPGDEITRGRRVRVYGVLNGTYSYTSQANWEITIPRFDAWAVVLSSLPRAAR